MAERTSVEVVINAVTEAAEEAIEDVGGELNNMSADAAPAQAAVGEVGDELNDVSESGAVAQGVLGEVGDEAASAAVKNRLLSGQIDEVSSDMARASVSANALSGSYSRLSASAGGLTVSMGTLSTMTTASLIPSLLTLSTALLPLVGMLSVIAAGAVSLAGAFGLVVGAGAVTHMSELQEAFAEARREIARLIEPLGEVFGPLLVDAVEALPDLVRRILAAIGPLEEFRDQLVALGEQAFDIIPGIVGAMFDLATIALPIFRDLVDFLVSEGGPAFETFMQTTSDLAPAFMELGGALGDVLPDLYEIGEVVLGMVLPALTALTDTIDTVAEFVNGLDSQFRDLGIAAAITAPAIFAIAGALGSLLGPVGIAAAAVAAFAAAYRSNFMGVRDVTNEVVGEQIERFNELTGGIDSIRASVEGVLSDVGRSMSEILTAVGPQISDLQENLGGLGEQLLAFGGDVADVVIPVMGQIMDTLGENQGAFEDLLATVMDIYNGFVTAVRGIVSIMRFGFNNFGAQALRGFANLFETHFGDILEEVDETLEVAVARIQWFVGVVEPLWNKWGDEITAVARFVGDVLSTSLIGTMDFLLTLIRVILNVIQGDWGEAWDAVVEYAERTTSRLTSLFTDWNIAGIISDIWDSIVDATINAIQDFVGYVADGMAALIAYVEGGANSVYNLFADMWNATTNLGIEAINNMIDVIEDGINEVINIANDTIDTANNVPGVDFDRLNNVSAPNIDEQTLQVDRRTTDFDQIRDRRRAQLRGILQLEVQGNGALSDAVEEGANEQVQVAEDDNRRELRRQNLGNNSLQGPQ